MNKPVRKNIAKSTVIRTEVFVQKAELQRSVEFTRIKILEEDVQTLPVLPLNGQFEGRQDLLLRVPGHVVRGLEVTRLQEYLGPGERQEQVQDLRRVAAGDAGEVN